MGLLQGWGQPGVGAAGVWGHQGISLGVLRSLHWHIQGTKAFQSLWFDKCSLFQCRGPPPAPKGLKCRDFSKLDKTSHFRGWKTSLLCFLLCKTTPWNWAVILYSQDLEALQG